MMDKSEEYYHTKFEGCIVVNMDMNSKQDWQASPGGFQRSIGMKIASGDIMHL